MFLSLVLYDYLVTGIGLEIVGASMNYYDYIMSLGSCVCLFTCILFSGAREARHIILELWSVKLLFQSPPKW